MRRSVLVVGLLSTAAFLSGSALAASYPGPVQKLVDDGVEIVSEFAAVGGLTAYIANANGEPLVIYALPDKEHVIVGQLFNGRGDNLTSAEVNERFFKAQNQAIVADIQKTGYWILDGSKNAPHIIYTFTDPNCGYCARLRQNIDPWIRAGKVQLRHVIVGALGQDSVEKAALIYGSQNREKALSYHQAHGKTGIKGHPEATEERMERGMTTTRAATMLMRGYGIKGTPTSFLVTSGSDIQRLPGAQSAEELTALFGNPD